MPGLRHRRVRRRARPRRLAVGRRRVDHRRGRAARRRADDGLDVHLLRRRGSRTVLLSWRAPGAARGGARRVLRAAADGGRGHDRARAARRTSSRCSSATSCCRSRSTCCARPRCGARARSSPGLKYLIVGSVGSATLLYGLAMLYGATGSTDFAGIAAAIGESDLSATRCCSPASRSCSSAWLQGLGRAVPPVDARRLRGRPDAGHRVHGGGDQGGGVRRSPCASSTAR